MNQIVLSADSSVYLLCISLIIYRIYEYQIKRKRCILINICLSFSLFAFSFFLNEETFLILWSVIQIVQILLIYLSFARLKFFLVLFIYIWLYSFNFILVVGINSFVPLSITALAIIELIVNVISGVCCIICCYNEKIKHKIQQILSTLPFKIKILTLFSFVTSAGLMSVIISSSDMYVISPWSVAVRISLVFFALFVCTTFPILIITVLTNTYLKKQNENFERELEAQANHYVAIAESNKELHRFKHDFKNLRIGITKALESGDSGMALSMIENSQKDFIDATESIVKFNTGNGIVDAILNEKQKAANSINTNLVFDGMIPQNIFTPTDLCVIFGNTLDNAIEACEKLPHSQEKTISVSVRCVGGIAFISITNPVEKKVVVNNNTIQTTKKNRAEHGFGLYSLNKIAKKYNGEMSIVSEDKKFTIMLDMYF